jgi:hypothetical protein
MRIDVSINSPAMLAARYARNTRGRQPLCAIINRGNGRAEVFHKSEHYVFDIKLRAFWRGLRENREKRSAFPPEFLFDGFAMHQFKLIAICLGLASSALGTCTSSIPSL